MAARTLLKFDDNQLFHRKKLILNWKWRFLLVKLLSTIRWLAWRSRLQICQWILKQIIWLINRFSTHFFFISWSVFFNHLRLDLKLAKQCWFETFFEFIIPKSWFQIYSRSIRFIISIEYKTIMITFGNEFYWNSLRCLQMPSKTFQISSSNNFP